MILQSKIYRFPNLLFWINAVTSGLLICSLFWRAKGSRVFVVLAHSSFSFSILISWIISLFLNLLSQIDNYNLEEHRCKNQIAKNKANTVKMTVQSFSKIQKQCRYWEKNNAHEHISMRLQKNVYEYVYNLYYTRFVAFRGKKRNDIFQIRYTWISL